MLSSDHMGPGLLFMDPTEGGDSGINEQSSSPNKKMNDVFVFVTGLKTFKHEDDFSTVFFQVNIDSLNWLSPATGFKYLVTHISLQRNSTVGN